jgi:hypothetical protein
MDRDKKYSRDFRRQLLHNVNNMTKVLKQLDKEGFELTPELLSGTSPYRNEHINLLGDYLLNINKKAGRREYKLFDE